VQRMIPTFGAEYLSPKDQAHLQGVCKAHAPTDQKNSARKRFQQQLCLTIQTGFRAEKTPESVMRVLDSASQQGMLPRWTFARSGDDFCDVIVETQNGSSIEYMVKISGHNKRKCVSLNEAIRSIKNEYTKNSQWNIFLENPHLELQTPWSWDHYHFFDSMEYLYSWEPMHTENDP